MSKPLLLVLFSLFALASPRARASVWQPPPGHTQTPLWPGTAPDAQPAPGPEVSTTTGKDDLVAGKPYIWVENVTRPTMTVYAPIDAADKESCRPDFAVGVYPGHLWMGGDDYKLNPNVPVTRQTPPTFLVQAEDDDVDGVNQSLAYYIALKNAGVPVEMHLYAHGGHAFGLRRTKFPITGWPRLAEAWLKTIGMLPN